MIEYKDFDTVAKANVWFFENKEYTVLNVESLSDVRSGLSISRGFRFWYRK